jgi:hypothetical protein
MKHMPPFTDLKIASCELGASGQSVWWQSPLFCALLGIVGVLGGLLLAEALHNKRARKKDLSELLGLLKMADAELSFYISVVKMGIEGAEDILQLLDKNGLRVSTFRVHPQLLDDLRRRIAIHEDTKELVKCLTYCHFELAHIADRTELMNTSLQENKSRIKEPEVKEILRRMIVGTIQLLKNNLNLFDEALALIRSEHERFRVVLSAYDAVHPFGHL